MSAAKHILIVDDSFEILGFLRSLLELADEDFRVVGVPSAEEAFLELHSRSYDLLITDLRLPGMGGLELVRRIRPRRPHMPVIAITAYTSAHNREEATALGIQRYFQKPLDPDTLLAAVRSALVGREDAHTAIIAAPARKQPDRAVDIYKRLQALHRETNAAQIVLTNSAGEVLFSSGHLVLDVSRVAKLALAGLESSFHLAESLQNNAPLTLLYQAGQQHDLYCVNIGTNHALLLLFESGVKHGRMSVVWVRIRQAVGELAEYLSDHPAGGRAATQERAPKPAPSTAGASPSVTHTGRRATAGIPEPPAADHTATPAAKPKPQPRKDPLLEMLNAFLQQDQVDLDAFWEQALSEEMGPIHQELSFEEARRRGLIPPALDQDSTP